MSTQTDSIILDASDLAAPVETHPDLPDHEEIPTDEISHELNGKPVFKVKKVPVRYYRKELGRLGTWAHRGQRRLSGEPREFGFTDKDFSDAIRNYQDRKERGILPFIPDTHVEQCSAAANNGQVINLERDGDGLYATMKLVGEKAIQKTLTNDVSVYMVNGNDQLVVDAGTGQPGSAKKYDGWVLHHVALTPDPNQPHLSPFQRIAASADAADARDVPVFAFAGPLSLGATMACTPAEMAMAKEHLASHGEDVSDLNPENAMGKVMTHAKKMADSTKSMQGKQDAARAVMALSADAELEPAIKTLKTDLDGTKASLQTVTKERDDAKAALAVESGKVLSLSAGEPDALTPWNLSAFEMNADTLREACIKNGKITAADAKSYSSVFRDAKNKPTRIALSATCDNGHPAELNFWRITAGLADTIRTDAGTKRPAETTVADPALALSAADTREGGAPQAETMRPDMIERMRRNLGLSTDAPLAVK